MKQIKSLISHTWKKYLTACSEYTEFHPEVSFVRARTLIDIFAIAWPEIIENYDQITHMLKINQLMPQDFSFAISSWAFKRLSLNQYMITTLLMGSNEKIISEAEFELIQQNLPEKMDTDQGKSEMVEIKRTPTITDGITDPTISTGTTLVG